ncbi:hypothetical protein BGZ72_009809 [Mortierella alpina]|nr:hypothetical protein BGZ72_009809 [Mortierella alpina]
MTVQKDTAKYPSKMPAAIFLDSGGVINDNAQRAPQWLQYLGEFLPTTVLGGTAQVWRQANFQIIKPFFSRWYEYMAQANELASQAAQVQTQTQAQAQAQEGSVVENNVSLIFERLHLLIWIKEMCKVAASQLPELETRILPSLTEDDLFQIAKSAHLYAIHRVQAAFPGAVETIRELASSPLGFRVYTSSGDSSEDLEIILRGLGVFECFDAVYGADKVNCLKMSPLYYEKVFAQAGVRVVARDSCNGQVVKNRSDEEEEDRDEVVVLDDSEKALRWAHVHGARTVLITDTELDLTLETNRHIDYQLRALSDLPGLLESWRVHLEEQEDEVPK